MSEVFEAPQSRIEAILQNILGADNDILPPFSRNETLLIEIAGLISGIEPKAVEEISTPLENNTTYYLSNVSSLTLEYPDEEHFECLLVIGTAASGSVTITFPNTTKYIGDVPTFDNNETWEISIRDGIAVCGKAVS